MLTICFPAAESWPTSRRGDISGCPSRTSRASAARWASPRRDQPQGAHLVSEVDVLGDGEAIDKIEFLVDRRDSQPHGRDRIGQPDLFALPRDRSLVRLVDPGQNLDQRRLARPVLAEQAMHLAGHDIQVDPVEGADTGELLDDRVHLQQRLSHGIPPTAPDPMNGTPSAATLETNSWAGSYRTLSHRCNGKELNAHRRPRRRPEDGRRPPRPCLGDGRRSVWAWRRHLTSWSTLWPERRPSFDQMTRALDGPDSQT